MKIIGYSCLIRFFSSAIPLRPIVTSMHAPATLISKFLNDLLAPVYLKGTRRYTFINNIDVIRRLEQYTTEGYLKLTTKFVTIDVKSRYTMKMH